MRFDIALSASQQKALALALALIPLAAIIGLMTTFVSSQIDRHARVAILIRELTRERALIAQSAPWESRLASAKSSSLWQGLFVRVPSSSQPNTIVQLITNAGGKVERSSITRIETSGAIELDEHVAFRADIAQLTQILTYLRGSRPVFVIRSLSIQDLEGTQTAPRSAPNALYVELAVAEFARP